MHYKYILLYDHLFSVMLPLFRGNIPYPLNILFLSLTVVCDLKNEPTF